MEGFAGLREKLLRAGIAPRHVRRYLRELTEHLADLTTEQREAGYDQENAAIRARALLGDDAELATAMEEQPGFRSFAARFPWLVFGIMPPPALLLSAFLQVILFILLAHFAGGLGPHGISVPERLGPVVAVMQLFGNFAAVPAVALLFVILALRQRMAMTWPLLSTVLIVGLSLHWDTAPWVTDPQGWGAAGISYRYNPATAIRFGVTPLFLHAWWKAMAAHGVELTLQYALLCLPLAWLLHRRHKAAA